MTEVAKIDGNIMLNVLRHLSGVLKEEISLLKAMKIAHIHKLYDEKIALISILEGYKEVIKNNPDILKTFPQKTIDELRKENDKFEVLIEEDKKQILRARAVHTVVMDAVKAVISRKVDEVSGYNKTGMINNNKKKILYIPPVSISESC